MNTLPLCILLKICSDFSWTDYANFRATNKFTRSKLKCPREKYSDFDLIVRDDVYVNCINKDRINYLKYKNSMEIKKSIKIKFDHVFGEPDPNITRLGVFKLMFRYNEFKNLLYTVKLLNNNIRDKVIDNIIPYLTINNIEYATMLGQNQYLVKKLKDIDLLKAVLKITKIELDLEETYESIKFACELGNIHYDVTSPHCLGWKSYESYYDVAKKNKNNIKFFKLLLHYKLIDPQDFAVPGERIEILVLVLNAGAVMSRAYIYNNRRNLLAGGCINLGPLSSGEARDAIDILHTLNMYHNVQYFLKYLQSQK